MGTFDALAGVKSERTLFERVVLSEADASEVFAKLQPIAKALKIPGWTASAAMEHGMARIFVKRRDGATIRISQHHKFRGYGNKWPTKLNISGDYLRHETGSGFYGVGYGDKTPEANVTLKQDDDPAKVAKRLASAIQKKVMPKYLAFWDKGMEEKKKNEAHDKASQSAADTLIAAFPNKVKPWSKDRLAIGTASGFGGKPYGYASPSGNIVDLELHNLSVEQVRRIIEIVRP